MPSSNVTVACCHKFFVDITQRAIFPKKEKDDLIFCTGVEIGISVILIDNSGVNLADFFVAKGRNVSFPNWAICIEAALSRSA